MHSKLTKVTFLFFFTLVFNLELFANTNIIKNEIYLLEFLYLLFLAIVIVSVVMISNYKLRQKIKKEIEKNYIEQDLMFQTNKNAELGSLIANISHQWRDSLTKIGYINLNLRARILQKKEIEIELLDSSTLQIEESLDFMSETMQTFLNYYKPSENITEFSIYDSIRSAFNIIDTKIKDNSISVKYCGDLDLKIKGIKNEWMHIWINLAVNSINIAILREVKNPLLTINIKENEIIFEDNCGKIDSNLLKEINKSNYKGIGIKMVKEIAKKNNKKVSISNTKEGALFRFYS